MVINNINFRVTIAFVINTIIIIIIIVINIIIFKIIEEITFISLNFK
jgi:hypothetical protein